MARLTIEQVAAPDLTGTSEILKRAGESFNLGMESAATLLGKYQEGQMAKGDQELAMQIAKLPNEEALDKYLATNPEAVGRASPEMLQTLLGTRKDVLGYGADRASIDSTVAGTANTRNSMRINSASESRTAAENADMVAGRAESRRMAGDILAATEQGLRYGNGAAPAAGNTRDILARTLQAEGGNQGYDGMVAVGAVIRNRADTGDYGDGIEGVIMKPGQFSAWNSVTGYANGEQGQDMANMTPSEEAYAAADAVLSGEYNDQTNGATHYFNPDISQPKWAEGRDWSRIGDHIFGNADGEGATRPVGPRAAIPVTENPAMAGGVSQQVSSIIGGAQYLDTTQALALANSVYQSQATGQAAITAAEEKAAADRSAQLMLDTAMNEDNVTAQDASIYALQNGAAGTATERLAQLTAANTNFGEGGALAPILAPGPGMDPTVSANADARIAEVAAAQERSTTMQALRGAEEFEAAPKDSLVAALEAMGASGRVPADIEGKINKFAKDMGISPGEAAYSFARAAEQDQGFLGITGADGIITFLGDGLSQSIAADIATTYFVGDKSAETRRAAADDEIAIQKANLAKTAFDRATEVYQKSMANNGEPSASATRKLQEAEEAYLAAMDSL